MEEAYSEIKGILVGGCNVRTMRYADNTTILVSNEKIHHNMLHKLVYTEKNYGMKINTDNQYR